MMNHHDSLSKQFFQVAMQIHGEAMFHMEKDRAAYEKRRILSLIKLHEGVQINELAYLIGYNEKQVENMLQALEKEQLLSLYTNEQGAAVKLAEKGRQLLGHQSKVKENDESFACLSGAEQETLSALLTKLSQSLEERNTENNSKKHGHMHDMHRRFQGRRKGFGGFHSMSQGCSFCGFDAEERRGRTHFSGDMDS